VLIVALCAEDAPHPKNEEAEHIENAGDEHVFSVDPEWNVDDTIFRIALPGDTHPAVLQLVQVLPLGYRIQHMGNYYDVKVMTPTEAKLSAYMKEKTPIDTTKMILSPMPGALRHVYVQEGDVVAPGTPLATVEAMKMQNVLRAVGPGKVKKIHREAGAILSVDELILELE